MKIGIITLHHNSNYGANLQAYALANTLKKLNGDSYLIDYRGVNIENLYRYTPYNRTFNGGKKLELNSIKRFIKMTLNLKGTLVRDKKFLNFRKTYIEMTNPVRSLVEIEKQDISTYFLGSDQIWCNWITKDPENIFWGAMKTKKNVVASYAPSFGVVDLPKEENDCVGKYVSNLDFLSVREESMIPIIENIIHKEAVTVCDPTILLNAEEWTSICNCKCANKKYLFVYILERNEEVLKIAKAIADELNLDIYIVSDGKKVKQNIGRYLACADPIEFLNFIKNAEFIVSNSFHGTVFSVLMNKQFVTVPHKKRGTRMIELLSTLKLSNRLCSSLELLDLKDALSKIDFSKSEKIIEDSREESLGYIKKVIAHKKGKSENE